MDSVLVIDDCPFVRKLVTSMLELSGCKVASASNGKEGEKILAGQQVDIVITDIFMPVQDGIETISSIRKNNPLVKIIAMSGAGTTGTDISEFMNIEPPYLKHAKLLGAHHTLTKPITPHKLAAAMDACRLI